MHGRFIFPHDLEWENHYGESHSAFTQQAKPLSLNPEQFSLPFGDFCPPRFSPVRQSVSFHVFGFPVWICPLSRLLLIAIHFPKFDCLESDFCVLDLINQQTFSFGKFAAFIWH